MKNSSAEVSFEVLRLEEVDTFLSLGLVSEELLARLGWSAGGLVVADLVTAAVVEVDLVLGPTKVPNTRERSSSPVAWGGERGDGNDGLRLEGRGEVGSSQSSGSMALRNLTNSFAKAQLQLSRAASKSWVACCRATDVGSKDCRMMR